jgi:steroid 5-alpha reductase family enzyme
MLLLWSVRLGLFLLYRVATFGKDSRFSKAKKHPPTFFMFWTMQGVWVLVVSMPVMITNLNLLGDGVRSTPESGAPDMIRPAIPTQTWFGIIAYLIGSAIEITADSQKLSFRHNPDNANDFIQQGIFRYCRYPNYFGEIVLQTGMFVACTPFMNTVQMAVAALSPIFTFVLLTRVSGIPILERQAKKRYGDRADFQAYKKSTSTLVPWIPAKLHRK